MSTDTFLTGDLLASLKCDCGEQLRGAVAAQHDVAVQEVLLDAEYQVLFPEPAVVRDVELLRHLVQLGDGFALQLRDVHEITPKRMSR